MLGSYLILLWSWFGCGAMGWGGRFLKKGGSSFTIGSFFVTIVEGDSTNMISLKRDKNGPWRLIHLVKASFLAISSNILFIWIPREVNLMADGLAKMGVHRDTTSTGDPLQTIPLYFVFWGGLSPFSSSILLCCFSYPFFLLVFSYIYIYISFSQCKAFWPFSLEVLLFLSCMLPGLSFNKFLYLYKERT